MNLLPWLSRPPVDSEGVTPPRPRLVLGAMRQRALHKFKFGNGASGDSVSKDEGLAKKPVLVRVT
jgi:hypothetical protein